MNRMFLLCVFIAGGRHPFLASYKVGYQSDGLITALEVDLYSNAGMSLDLSAGIMDRAMFHMENAYYIPNIRVKGFICRTNLPSNTAFRGFGAPQSMFLMETIIGDIAIKLNQLPNKVLIRNYSSNLYTKLLIIVWKLKLNL